MWSGRKFGPQSSITITIFVNRSLLYPVAGQRLMSSTSEPQIRLATHHDANTIAQLINLAFEVERFFIDGDRISVTEVQALMFTGSFFVGSEEDRAVATVYAERRDSGRGYIGLLAVDPACQGRGIGRLLMTVAENHCAQLGCRGADIRIVSLRTELPPFYTLLGYRETGTEPFPDSRAQLPCHFIWMSKEFGAS
jgi:ribosomal protein S18 acetylase RimI-like enzyme